MGLTWRFYNSDPNTLGSYILASKYKSKPSASGSQIWKSITLGWTICQEGLFYHLGDGRSISFQSDKWCTEPPLQSLFHGPLPENHYTHTVNYYISDQIWNLPTLSFVLPNNILDKITSTFIPNSLTNDSFVWDHTQNGLFSIKSSYNFLQSTFSQEPVGSKSKDYSWLWKKTTNFTQN